MKLGMKTICKKFKAILNPKDFIMTSDKCFVYIVNGAMGGSHWNCFYMKDKKSFYFESFCGQADNFSLYYLSKPIFFLNIKVKMSIVKCVERIAYTFSI